MGPKSIPQLPDRVLCLVAGPGPRMSSTELVDAIDAAIRGGVNMVQLRDRVSTGQARIELAAAVRDVTRNRAVLVVNGDPELTARTGADGVHLPEAAMPVSKARRYSPGPGSSFGRSVHSAAAARSAFDGGAPTTWSRAPCTHPPTHPGGQASGTAIIRDVVGVVDLPVIGIGGIDASNAARVSGRRRARGGLHKRDTCSQETRAWRPPPISDAINQQKPGGDTR